MKRISLAFVVAVVATYVVAVVLAAQVNLHELASFGLSSSIAVRVETSLSDIAGMLVTYLPLVVVSLVVAMPVSALALRVIRIPRWLGYVIGGAAGLWALHMIMFSVFGIHAVPATRHAAGMASQVIAGALGGYAYAQLSQAMQSTERTSLNDQLQ